MPATLSPAKVQSLIKKAANLGTSAARYDSVEWAVIFKELGCYAIVDHLEGVAARRIDDYGSGAIQGIQKFLNELAADKAQKEYFEAAHAVRKELPVAKDLFSDYLDQLFKGFIESLKKELPVTMFVIAIGRKYQRLKKEARAAARAAGAKSIDARTVQKLCETMSTRINEVEQDCQRRARACLYETALVCATQSKSAARKSAEQARNVARVKANLTELLRLHKKLERGRIKAKDYQRAVEKCQKQATEAGVMEWQGGEVVVTIDAKERSGLQKMMDSYFPELDKNTLRDNVARTLASQWKEYKKNQALVAVDMRFLSHWRHFFSFTYVPERIQKRFIEACSRSLGLRLTLDDLGGQAPIPAALKRSFPNPKVTSPGPTV